MGIPVDSIRDAVLTGQNMNKKTAERGFEMRGQVALQTHGGTTANSLDERPVLTCVTE
jgi:hypothetical protein